MSNECTPLYRPGDEITCLATTAITGKRFVNITANRDLSSGLIKVGTPTAAGKVFGVAARDAASGTRVVVMRVGVLPITAAGSITAGSDVEVTATGAVVTLASGAAVGKAVENGTNGSDVLVAINPR